MALNPRQTKKMQKSLKVNTASTTTEQRKSKKQISTAALSAIRKAVDLFKPVELSNVNRNRTYMQMLLDDSVWSGFDNRATSIELSQNNGRFVYNKNSETSKELKDFFEYTMNNLEGQTPRSVARAMAEMIIFGWAPHEIVPTKIDDPFSEFDKMFTLKKLAYIHPLSLDQGKPFEVAQGGDKITVLRQTAAAFAGSDGYWMGIGKVWTGIKEIDYRNIVAASYSATSTMPYGNSPFDSIYVVWKEKVLLQDYLLNGVQRDFSGTPLLRIPSDVLEAAEADPNSSEAKQILGLRENMMMMHSGDNAYLILPSDSQNDAGTGALDYDVKFLGVDGGNKNFNITEIITEKKKGIHLALTTQHLILGESGGGSFNLHDGQINTSALVSERDNIVIDEVWNKVVFPKMLRLNGINVPHKDIPVWKHGNAQPISMEEQSKAFQRMQNYLPIHVDVVNHALKVNNIDLILPEETTYEDLMEIMPPVLSKGGQDNGGTSGTGTTQSSDAGSDKNNENKA